MTAADCRLMVMGLTGIVLHDLIGVMEESIANLHVSTAKTEADAIAQLAEAQSWTYAFLNLGPNAFKESALSKILSDLGAKVILLGNTAEDAAETSPYPVLVRPFIADDILRILG